MYPLDTFQNVLLTVAQRVIHNMVQKKYQNKFKRVEYQTEKRKTIDLLAFFNSFFFRSVLNDCIFFRPPINQLVKIAAANCRAVYSVLTNRS